MQNFRAEVSQLGCLFEMQLAYGRSLVHDTRVVVVHPVNVRPDLDFLGLDSGADEGSRVVASAALEVVDFSVGVAADISLGDVQVCLRMLVEQLLEFLADIQRVRLSVFVRPHEIQRREENGIDAAFVEIEVHHPRGH